MILIADSGSTKTSWALCDPTIQKIWEGPGMHPGYSSEDELIRTVEESLSLFPDKTSVSRICFYGSGCLKDQPASRMKRILGKVFSNTRIEVQSDLAGAAISSMGHDSGIIAILGTGSSAARWDGQSISSVNPSLGYLIGDEGSGAHLGKELLKAVFYNILDDDLMQSFQEYDPRDKAEILQEIHTAIRPGEVLASYVGFIKQQISQPGIQNLVTDCLHAFIKTHLLPLKAEEQGIHFCGGVAYEFQSLLEKGLTLSGLKATRIIKSPIHGLVDYHLKEIKACES